MKKKFKINRKSKVSGLNLEIGMNLTASDVVQLKSSDIPILRAQLLDKQGGNCPICRRSIKDACLDHSHIKRIKGTGLVRGVLCRTCNVFIAKSENNASRYGITQNDLPEILRNMADYLQRDHLPFIHPSEREKEPRLMKSSYNKLKKKMLDDGIKGKFPEFPKSGKLTVQLKKYFDQTGIEPEFYK